MYPPRQRLQTMIFEHHHSRWELQRRLLVKAGPELPRMERRTLRGQYSEVLPSKGHRFRARLLGVHKYDSSHRHRGASARSEISGPVGLLPLRGATSAKAEGRSFRAISVQWLTQQCALTRVATSEAVRQTREISRIYPSSDCALLRRSAQKDPLLIRWSPLRVWLANVQLVPLRALSTLKRFAPVPQRATAGRNSAPARWRRASITTTFSAAWVDAATTLPLRQGHR